MVGAGHDRLPARLVHGRFDLGRIRRDDDRPDRGCLGPAQHMHDHRQSGDIGERLARQAARRHAGGNKNNDVSHCAI